MLDMNAFMVKLCQDVQSTIPELKRAYMQRCDYGIANKLHNLLPHMGNEKNDPWMKIAVTGACANEWINAVFGETKAKWNALAVITEVCDVNTKIDDYDMIVHLLGHQEEIPNLKDYGHKSLIVGLAGNFATNAANKYNVKDKQLYKHMITAIMKKFYQTMLNQIKKLISLLKDVVFCLMSEFYFFNVDDVTHAMLCATELYSNRLACYCADPPIRNEWKMVSAFHRNIWNAALELPFQNIVNYDDLFDLGTNADITKDYLTNTYMERVTQKILLLKQKAQEIKDNVEQKQFAKHAIFNLLKLFARTVSVPSQFLKLHKWQYSFDDCGASMRRATYCAPFNKEEPVLVQVFEYSEQSLWNVFASHVLEHPNILKVRTCLFDEKAQQFTLLYEQPDCNLHIYLQQNNQSDSTVLQILHDIANAISHMHSQGFGCFGHLSTLYWHSNSVKIVPNVQLLEDASHYSEFQNLLMNVVMTNEEYHPSTAKLNQVSIFMRQLLQNSPKLATVVANKIRQKQHVVLTLSEHFQEMDELTDEEIKKLVLYKWIVDLRTSLKLCDSDVLENNRVDEAANLVRIKHAPPEMLKSNKFLPSSQVWGAGMSLFFSCQGLSCKQEPYASMSGTELLQIQIPELFEYKGLLSIAKQCCALDPMQRLTTKQLDEQLANFANSLGVNSLVAPTNPFTQHDFMEF